MEKWPSEVTGGKGERIFFGGEGGGGIFVPWFDGGELISDVVYFLGQLRKGENAITARK